MSKRRFYTEKLPPRKDGKKRSKRQIQNLVNNLNFAARKYYDKRHEHKEETRRLKSDNRIAVNMIASLRSELNATSHELALLKVRLKTKK